jgi:ectoine hydroxylase-related dioxygenase (phytanoyl-CoA dioxygenase family)
MRAGDALLFTHALWHGAAGNNSERPRKTLIYGYIQRFLKPYDYEKACPQVLSMCTPRQRLLLGDLGGWHWRAGCHYYEGPEYLPTMLGAVPSASNTPAPLMTDAQVKDAAQLVPQKGA